MCRAKENKEIKRPASNDAAPINSNVDVIHPRFDVAISAAHRRLDRSDVDLFHRHHGIEGTLGDGGIGTTDRFRQRGRRNLPRQSPFILTPAALALLAAVADDRVPIAIRFGLVIGCDLKRECQVVLDPGSAVIKCQIEEDSRRVEPARPARRDERERDRVSESERRCDERARRRARRARARQTKASLRPASVRENAASDDDECERDREQRERASERECECDEVA